MRSALLKRILIGCLFFLFLLSFSKGICGAVPPTNDDCMGCHSEKGMTKKGPNGKEVSLVFETEPFKKSVHGNLQCVSCHDIKEVPHADTLKEVSCQACHKNSYKMNQQSAHRQDKGGKASCKGCHGYHTVQKTKTMTSATCADCHSTAYGDYKAGIHAHNGKDTKKVATCEDCHGKGHSILKKDNPQSSVHVLNIAKTCSTCHANQEIIQKYKIPEQNVYPLYSDSIHGKAIQSGHISASCSNCHGAHAIKPHTDPTSQIHPANISATCGQCHSQVEAIFKNSIHGQQLIKKNPNAPNCASCHPAHRIQSVKTTPWMLEAIKECGSCHVSPLETYRHSYHGKITNLGFTRVAKCADCHGAHEVLPHSDPHSKISKENIIDTCKQCHPKANKAFTEFIVHANYRNKTDYPILYYVWRFMVILLVAVFGFFGIHTLLWLPRSWIERFKEQRGKRKK